jgi:soluble lytic murein transglycosylase-like protein
MRQNNRYMRLVLLCLLAAGSGNLFAGEFAVLASGARLYADRHEADAAKVRLYNGTGFVELDASSVKGFEIEDAAPASAVPPAPVAAQSPAVSPSPTALELADAAADKYGLPRELVRSVMAVESGFATSAVSRKGAIGLMQLMPETARDLGVNPNDPAQNVDGGTRYLRDLLLKYDGGLRHALAAYNAGPAAVEKYNGVPPYAETMDYIGRVERLYRREQAAGSR